ncbi:MAG: MmcQ/YjbR family DNA-binding protein [Pseudomonadota bacterium]
MKDWDEVRSLAARLPEVEESVAYGWPALKIGRALLTRLREDGESLTLHDVPAEERAMLIQAEPDVFFTTAHYDGHDIVLARLHAIAPERLFPFLERRWRGRAPKRAIRKYGAE